jgi:hypothetical protein
MKQFGTCPACGKPLNLVTIGMAVAKWGGAIFKVISAAQGRPTRPMPYDPHMMRRCVVCRQIR